MQQICVTDANKPYGFSILPGTAIVEGSPRMPRQTMEGPPSLRSIVDTFNGAPVNRGTDKRI
jgi:hypothetical protein